MGADDGGGELIEAVEADEAAGEGVSGLRLLLLSEDAAGAGHFPPLSS